MTSRSRSAEETRKLFRQEMERSAGEGEVDAEDNVNLQQWQGNTHHIPKRCADRRQNRANR